MSNATLRPTGATEADRLAGNVSNGILLGKALINSPACWLGGTHGMPCTASNIGTFVFCLPWVGPTLFCALPAVAAQDINRAGVSTESAPIIVPPGDPYMARFANQTPVAQAGRTTLPYFRSSYDRYVWGQFSDVLKKFSLHTECTVLAATIFGGQLLSYILQSCAIRQRLLNGLKEQALACRECVAGSVLLADRCTQL